jgi:dibenzofuran dioxygenase beta subunit
MVSRRPLDVQLQLEIERFLYLEARLLDDQEFDRWLDLYAEDTRYWVPIRETRLGQQDGSETEHALAVPHIDEDKRGLRDRVQRLQSGLAHAETPPSRTRHHISNVEVWERDEQQVEVFSSFMVFQGRRERSEFLFTGRREDLLRRVDGEWLIVRRKVLLDHTVLPRAISVFF